VSKRSRKINELLEGESSPQKNPARAELEALDAEYAAEEAAARKAAEEALQTETSDEPKETGRVTKTGKLVRDVDSTKAMEFDYPPEDTPADVEETKVNVSKKKKSAKKKSKPAPKKAEPEKAEETPKRRKKDDYYVFRQVKNPKTDKKAWILSSEPMRNVSECDKYVKEAGEKYEGAVLMIAQVKKVAKVEAVVKKTIKF